MRVVKHRSSAYRTDSFIFSLVVCVDVEELAPGMSLVEAILLDTPSTFLKTEAIESKFPMAL